MHVFLMIRYDIRYGWITCHYLYTFKPKFFLNAQIMEGNITEFLNLSDIEGALPSLDALGDGSYGQIEFKFIKDALLDKGFENINEIERGSSGIVVSVNKSDSKSSEKSYAIKTIRLEKDPQKQKQYRRELNIMRQLVSCDQIVGYFAHWPLCIDNAYYLSIQMELCWRSLNTIIQEQRDVIKALNPPRFYQQVFPQILEGLREIHKIGWVHRDIHPGNILIVRPFKIIRDCHVKIADFGNAKEIKSIMEASGEVTVSAEPSFTLPYNAPERNNRYDYKIDLFLAGVVLCSISGIDPYALSKPFVHEDDDILIDLFRRLLKGVPELRPTAGEALELAWKERKFYVELQTPGVIDASCLPCVTIDNTIHSLKAVINLEINRVIESDIPILPKNQVLQQKKIINGQVQLTDITLNEHVKKMFKDKEDDVCILVSLQTTELSRSDLAIPEA